MRVWSGCLRGCIHAGEHLRHAHDFAAIVVGERPRLVLRRERKRSRRATVKRRLFDLLHEADASPKPRIAVAPVPNEGLGLAINDRLRRAAV